MGVNIRISDDFWDMQGSDRSEATPLSRLLLIWIVSVSDEQARFNLWLRRAAFDLGVSAEDVTAALGILVKSQLVEMDDGGRSGRHLVKWETTPRADECDE